MEILFYEDDSRAGAMLQKVCPQLINELQILLNKCDRSDVASQLPKVLVVPQEISGTPEDCSFLAYPVPMLTFEQRHAMELVDCESVSLQINLDNRVIIDLNDFGKINWFYMKGLPNAYFPLKKVMNPIGN